MNKKGFATSTIVFALLSVFLISISILLVTITNTNRTKNALNEKVVSNIEYGNSSINDIEQRLEELENTTNNLLDKIYPVGSVYISTTDDTVEKVQKRFGGTWEKYSEGRTIIGEGTGTDSNGIANIFKVNQVGGEYSHTLTISELPSHAHGIPSLTGTTSIKKLTGDIIMHNANGYTNVHGLSGVFSSASVNSSFQLPTTSSGGAISFGTISFDGTHDHTLTTKVSNTESAGKSTSFNIQNPYIVTYIYKRVK